MSDVRHVGLARALSKLGYCSRAQAGELIRAGRVTLNGRVRRDPETPVRLASDRIEVEGRAVRAAKPVYLMLNKPRGLVTTARDEKNRETIYSCLPAGMPWVGPVGRLDQASEGLLLLTNDGEWAAGITAPESGIEKVYDVQVRGLPEKELLETLRAGVCERGEWLRARRVSVRRSGPRNGWLEFVLDEGKNRHIRRMLAAVGVEVLRLVRVAIGPLRLGQLAKGAVRELTRSEVEALWRRGRKKAETAESRKR